MDRSKFSALKPLLIASVSLAALYYAGRVSVAALDREAWFRPTAVSAGEELIHGLPHATASMHMPLVGVIEATLANHLSRAERQAVLFFLALLLVALIAAVGCLLGSWQAAMTAAGLFLFTGIGFRAFDEGACLPYLYSLLLLVVSGVLLWRAEKPGAARSLAAGAALGVALLYRSPLAFFPLVAAAAELAGPCRWDWRGHWKRLACLGLVPYVFLLPWLRLNWTIYREIVPFERGGANSLLVSGALGIVSAVEGDWRALIPGGLTGTDSPGVVLAWALAEILGHPLRYASSWAGRAAYIVGLQPVLFGLGLAAAWLLRRDKRLAPLSLLAVYFTGIFSLVSVQAAYLFPIYPLLAILASQLFFLPARRREAPGPRVRLAAQGVVSGSFVLVLLLSLYAVERVLAYPAARAAGTRPSAAAVERALDRYPEDPWLLAARATRKLERGDPLGALRDFGRARMLEAAAGRSRLDFDVNRALALTGRVRPLLSMPSDEQTPPAVDIAKAGVYFLQGREELAVRHWRSAADRQTSTVHLWKNDAAAERAVETALRSVEAAKFNARFLPELTAFRSAEDKDRLYGAVTRLAPRDIDHWLAWAEDAAARDRHSLALRCLDRAKLLKPTAAQSGEIARLSRAIDESYSALWIDRADAARRAGRPADARRALSRLGAPRLTPGQAERAAGIYEDLREYDRAARLSLDSRSPGGRTAAFCLQRARALTSARRTAAALGYLRLAETLAPTGADLAQIGFSYGELGRADKALSVLARLAGDGRHDDAWVQYASIAARAARPTAARAGLARISLRNASPVLLQQTALVYQQLRDYRSALRLFDRIVRENPRAAAYYRDRGICEYEAGRTDEALADLNRSVELNPRLISSHLSLIAVYSDQRRTADARRQRRLALEQAPEAGEEGLLPLLESAGPPG